MFDGKMKVPTALLYRQYVAFHGNDRGVKGERSHSSSSGQPQVSIQGRGMGHADGSPESRA